MSLLITTVLLTLAMTVLSGRRWTLGRSLVALTLGQVVLHTIFTALFPSIAHGGAAPMPDMVMADETSSSMALAHAAVTLLISVGMAVNDSALDTYFQVASSVVGSGLRVLAPWRLVALVPVAGEATQVGHPNGAHPFMRWQRPRILNDLVVLQCLSRRGPPALTLGF